MMQISNFPEFQEIEISHQGQISELLKRHPLEASEYTFTNLFAFKGTYNIKISLLDASLIILKDIEPKSFFCPAGEIQSADVLDVLFDWLKSQTDEACIERVPESFVHKYVGNSDDFIIEETRDHFDYLYNVEELVELKGRKYHDKRNKVNKFRTLYKYQYLPLTPDLIDDCLDFEDSWCEVKECEKFYGLEKERTAILQMLLNFEALNITGGVIRINERIEALTLAEQMMQDTIVIHVEKANTDIPGLYQVINQEFLQHDAQDYTYVNREQDLGVPGLRKSKMSYNPVRLVRKFKIKKKL
ncbi:MAG: DUF2156 domain-containing protein [Nitrospiraceae bacterium]|nr:MAG: DUF2156 domain-containing protein [Nitrospiraceae bacterium]